MKPEKKNTLRTYFTFNAREIRAVILLSILIIIFFIAPYVIPNMVTINMAVRHNPQPTTDTVSFDQSFKKDHQHLNKADIPEQTSSVKLYPFDPNKLTAEEWKDLGVRKKTATTIMNYRQKGGRFDHPEDLRKIWGLSNELADKLIPYVHIEKAQKQEIKINHSKQLQAKQIDINSAVQEDWESLPGIGPSLASRIMKFREKLGGFVSIEQVGQTYGLPDSTFQKIRSRLNTGESPVRLLNINQLSVEELSKHPLIRYRIARAIVQYREQHGAYHSVQELQKIESLTKENYILLEPYITVD